MTRRHGAVAAADALAVAAVPPPRTTAQVLTFPAAAAPQASQAPRRLSPEVLAQLPEEVGRPRAAVPPAWMYCVSGHDPAGRPLALVPADAPAAQWLSQRDDRVGAGNTGLPLVDALLAWQEVFGDELPHHAPLRQALQDLRQRGVAGAMAACLQTAAA